MGVQATSLRKLKAADTEYEIHPLIAARYSPRMFAEEKVDETELHQLFEAARWAPSSNNAQPWRFPYAYKGEVGYADMFGCLSEFNQGWVGNASLLVFGIIKEKFDNGKDNYHALHDLGLAVANMTLQAQSMGIAVHQMAGVSWEKAQQVFNIPEGFHVATAIAIGYYGGNMEDLSSDLQKKERAERNRKPQRDFVFKGRWE